MMVSTKLNCPYSVLQLVTPHLLYPVAITKSWKDEIKPVNALLEEVEDSPTKYHHKGRRIFSITSLCINVLSPKTTIIYINDFKYFEVTTFEFLPFLSPRHSLALSELYTIQKTT